MTRPSPLPRFGAAAVTASLIASLLTVATLADPAAARTTTEATMANEIVAAINAERAARGIPTLSRISDTHAQGAAETMRSLGRIQHSLDLGVYPYGVKENIGYAASGAGARSGRVPYLWMASTGHRAAMLSLDSDRIAVGVACTNGTVYVAAHMVASSQTVAQRPTPSNPPSSPVVTSGRSGTRCPAPGSGASNGVDTIGSVRGRTVMLRNLNSAGPTSTTLTLPRRPDQVFSGDWNGNGVDTIGYRKGARFYLLSSNSNSAAVRTFSYGRPGDLVVIGDWNGDGTDTVGVRRGNVFYLRNRNSGGRASLVLGYGKATDTPVVGDWNGDGVDTFGVRRGSLYYLRNLNTTGRAHLVFSYGRASDLPLSGDWNGR